MSEIKFGTDGWRAIIAKDFTVENVTRVSQATAAWLCKNFKEPSVVLGHDCRFGGELFVETVAKVLAHSGIRVYMAKNFVSTPMVSLGTLRQKASLGIIITASHNPPSYNGFKLKGHFGGPLLTEHIQEIENIIPKKSTLDTETISLSELIRKKLIEPIDLEGMYCEHVKANFDIRAIRASGLNFAYDAMYGAGQNVIKRLFPEVETLHCEYNPSFMGQAPEPIHKNLQEFSKYIKDAKGDIACGLATDGDADRIGLYDSDGNFVDSHHIILLLIKYLVEEKKMTGKVVTAFSVTPRVVRMCEHFKLQQQTVKIGFKHIAGIMTTEDVLLGGEESGGIAVKGHIPERDGIWMGLIIWEFMAKSGKSLKQLIKEVYEITGSFAFERYDLHLKEELKNTIVENCKSGKMKSFGKYKVQRMEDTDGWKYFFSDDEWLMIRASGTEPVLRTYAESSSRESAFAILDEAKKVLLN
ncbi:MAG: phosphoglucomutase/phosphomannomutase family protein [Bacteroidia bacterium]